MAWRSHWQKLLVAVVSLALVFPVPAQAQFSDGYKFLEAVRKREGEDAMKLLNEPGSTVINARDLSSGEGALHIVARRRDLTWTRFLLQKGANPNVRDKKGVTPLVVAASLGFVEGVQELIGAGALIDEANDSGETPLMSAVHRRDTELVRILLKAGADPDRADNSGRSARDYATIQGEGSSTLAEIRAHVKSPGDRKGGQVYGPSF